MLKIQKVNITVYRLAWNKNVAIIDQHTKFENMEVPFVGSHTWPQQPENNYLLWKWVFLTRVEIKHKLWYQVSFHKIY